MHPHHHHHEDVHEILHKKGLKVTPLREALMKVLMKQKSPLSVEEITVKLKGTDFDQATLFRSLKKFADAEIISQIDLGEGFLRFEYSCTEHGHHHHVMCSGCKKITILPFCIPKKFEEFLEKAGYTNITHRMDFTGLCASCS